ncbi:uncharacterized protein BDV14DRAFT_197018 [Aspergillus stella-maris]|uniref:uncharacterized protein n=1 Tax=Aspergillus stella-maris TaxID=1810926 RepID=UPI003CCE32B0
MPTPIPTITITPTPDTPLQPTPSPSGSPLNSVWILYNASGHRPKLSSSTPGLTITQPNNLLLPSWGVVESESEPIRLKRVVLITPIPEVDSLSENLTIGLDAHMLVKVCERTAGEAPKVGDVSEGVLMLEGAHLRFGAGRVVAVLEDVMVFMVKKKGV